MKKRFLALISLLCLCSCSEEFVDNPQPLDPSAHYDNVYVIMGQSNATGISQASFLATKSPEVYDKYSAGNPNVLIAADVDGHVYEDFQPVRFGFGADEGYFGPEIGMSETLETNEPIYFIKATLSGSCLQTQYIDSNGDKYDLYNRYIPFILNRMNSLKEQGKNPRLRGVFWMQGESDSIGSYANTYEKATKQFVNNLRTDFYEYIYDHMNFVDTFISTKSPHWEHADKVNLAKDKVASLSSHNYCIHTNGEDDNAIDLVLKSQSGEENDAAHYDSLSMLYLGVEAGKYLIK